jgi:hypothetical protein
MNNIFETIFYYSISENDKEKLNNLEKYFFEDWNKNYNAIFIFTKDILKEYRFKYLKNITKIIKSIVVRSSEKNKFMKNIEKDGNFIRWLNDKKEDEFNKILDL